MEIFLVQEKHDDMTALVHLNCFCCCMMTMLRECIELYVCSILITISAVLQ